MESPQTLIQASREREPPAESPPRRRIAARAGEPRAAESRASEPGAEDLVLGRYRMLERLGSGGFGEVWRAHDELLHREVAVKRVWLEAGGGPIDSDRATREALAAARLAHPAIVALYEACAKDGAFYLISELVDGDTLAQLIDDEALADEEVLEIGLALASALAHAHARGVIHRDIKPQNVLVPNPPEDRAQAPQALIAAAKLTDFGGASLVGEEALTRTGDVLGTLAYMAPEQSDGREVGMQADLYSLALVIYEALSGENPVRGATPAATARRIGRTLPPLARARRDLPAQLTRALDRALAPAPGDRGTLADLHDALEQTLARGLQRSRWRRARPAAAQRVAAPEVEAGHVIREPIAHTAAGDVRRVRAPAPAFEHEHVAHQIAEQEPAAAPRHGLRLPRGVWLACALVLIGWQAFSGRPGVALLVFAALLPLALLPSERGDRRLGMGWIAAALAPVLGLAGLAGAFPAIAGQPSRWRERAALGALGYWWLALAGPLLARKLWLAEPAGTPAHSAWEGSLSLVATHVIAPLLALGVLLGALLWAAGGAVLPWLVRGRSAVRDVVAVTVWSAAIAAAAPALDAGLSAHAMHPTPRGAVLGAILGAIVAVAARALRGPV
ncbi:MAG: protein kinase domain-containing protein [Solirubrobacteraceae bacterium]